MNLDDYPPCDTLEEIAERARHLVDDGQWVANLRFRASFRTDILRKPGLKDVAATAELWQSVERPDKLFFSHGEYLGKEGLEHIVEELGSKPDSNRALASLISQTHILKSGDTPLPSFLAIQCMIDGPTLYVTMMYRALELSTFLRINLEEMRLMALPVYEANRRLTHVALCVFATRAYRKEGMNPLEKCEIDQLQQIDLMTTHRARLPTLLRDKERQSTYPVAEGLENLLAVVRSEALPAQMRVPGASRALIRSLEDAISSVRELRKLRETSSHHQHIAELEAKLAGTLESIARTIEENS
jgi:hypothetical protein